MTNHLKRHVTQFDDSRHISTVATPTGSCSCCCCCCCLATISSSTILLAGAAERRALRKRYLLPPASRSWAILTLKILLAVLIVLVAFVAEVFLAFTILFFFPIYFAIVAICIVWGVALNKRKKQRLVEQINQAYQAHAHQS